MKRFSLFLVCLLATAGMAQAGGPLTGYIMRKTKPVALHTFSANATTIEYLQAGDTIAVSGSNPKFSEYFYENIILGNTGLLPINSRDTVLKGDGVRPIGFTFPLDKSNFTHFGLSGSGSVYFGTAENGITPGRVSRNTNEGFGGNYIYLSFIRPTDKYTNTQDGREEPATVRATVNTRIQYETVGDTLYIGFKDLSVINQNGQATLTATFQYKITVDGDISLIIGDITPTENNNFNFRYAVQARSGNETVVRHLADWNGRLHTHIPTEMPLGTGSDSLQNTEYKLMPPPPCEPVSGLEIIVDGKINAGINTIEFHAYGLGWNQEIAPNLLVMLSPSSDPLKNLLTDGTVYKEIDTIGGYMSRVSNANGYLTPFNGLTENTEYYLHIFPFNATTCAGGPLYGQETVVKVLTTFAPPADISATEVDSTSVTVSVTSADKYVLAVSDKMLGEMYAASGVLKNGTVYTVGQQETYGDKSFRILAVGVDAPTVKAEQLQVGQDCYFYAWATRGEGENVRYSKNYTEIAEKTVSTMPVSLDFSNYISTAYFLPPAGWHSSQGVRSPHFVLNNKGDVITSYFIDDDVYAGGPVTINDSAEIEGNVAYVWAASPWMKGNGDLQVVFNVTFFTYNASNGAFAAYNKLQDQDSLVLQIQEQGQAEWKAIGRLNKRSDWKGGFGDVVSETFQSDKTFRIRAVLYQNKPEETVGSAANQSSLRVAIRSMRLEASKDCKYPANIAAPIDSMGYRTVKLMWTDPNTSWNNSFVVKYHEVGDTNGWYTERTNETEIVLGGLKPGKDYVAEINTVCSAEETSAAREIFFKTARNIIYEQKGFDVDNISDLGYFSLKGMLGAELSPLADGEYGWFAFTDETAPGEPSVAMIDKITAAANSWLIVPVLFSGFDGKVKLTAGMSAWLDDVSGAAKERKEATGIQNDTLFIYRSANRTFTAESEIVGKVALNKLTSQYQNLEFEFEVKAAEPNVFAFYFRKIADNGNASNQSSLGINLIKFEYTEADFPAVTRLRTANVTRTGFTASWEGEAESYAFLLKKSTDKKYDTAYTENTEHAVTGLEEGTTYDIRVFGYYGADHTLPGPAAERSVRTSSAPYCGTPTELTSEYDPENNSALLSWTPGENNNSSTDIYFRTANTQKYDTATAPNTSYKLENMQTEVVYYWCVQARCNTYFSEVSGEVEIKTVSNAAQDYARDLAIRVNGRQIVVENAAHRFIKALNVYSATGVLLKTYAANTNDNVFIQTDLNQGLVLIEAVGAGAERFAVKAVIM